MNVDIPPCYAFQISSNLCTDPCSDYDTAKSCNALSKCKSLVWSKPVLKDDNVCRFCEGQIKALQEFVKDNATEAEVKQRLVSFCNSMKLSAFKDEVNILFRSCGIAVRRLVAHTAKPLFMSRGSRYQWYFGTTPWQAVTPKIYAE